MCVCACHEYVCVFVRVCVCVAYVYAYIHVCMQNMSKNLATLEEWIVFIVMLQTIQLAIHKQRTFDEYMMSNNILVSLMTHIVVFNIH